MDKLEFDIELFEKGDYIFKEDAPTGGAYLIAAGAVEISKIKHGEKVILATKREDEIFGEMSIISNEDRSASAQAIELTTCYKLTEQDFENIIKSSHPFMRAIFEKLSGIIREQTSVQTLVHAASQLKEKSEKDAEKREERDKFKF
jgi:CRP/FNR family cyclic AMP-dependent transcriptional regulator